MAGIMWGWRFQWRRVVGFMIFCALLGIYVPNKHGPGGGPIRLVDTGFLPNLLMWLVIGVLLGTSAGGLPDYIDLSDKQTEWRITLRGLLGIVAWFAVLTFVVVYVLRHLPRLPGF